MMENRAHNRLAAMAKTVVAQMKLVKTVPLRTFLPKAMAMRSMGKPTSAGTRTMTLKTTRQAGVVMSEGVVDMLRVA